MKDKPDRTFEVFKQSGNATFEVTTSEEATTIIQKNLKAIDEDAYKGLVAKIESFDYSIIDEIRHLKSKYENEVSVLNLKAYQDLIEKLEEVNRLRQEISQLRQDKVVEYQDLYKKYELEEAKVLDLSLKLSKFENSEKLFCRVCKHTNNHIKISEPNIVLEDEDDEGQAISYSISETWQCQGCGITVTKQYSQDSNENQSKPIFIPEYKNWHLTPRSEFDKLDNEGIKKTYKEVIDNFNKGNELSCSMMIRALIESIGIVLGIKDELIAEGKNHYSIKIEDMLDRLVEKGIVTENTSDILVDLRFLGNEAAHQMVRHDRKEQKLAIQIIENIIENIFIIPKISQELQNISNTRRSTK